MMGYNQHQSFYLRDRWLSKGIRNTVKQPSFFFEKDAFEKIGIGKNMVQSLRHWVKATGVMKEERKEKVFELTEFGTWLKDNDITVQHFETAALLHYFIVKNIEPSTTWYWFFNIFDETATTKVEIFDELLQWVQTAENRVISENSIKRDVDCLVKMYTAGGSSEDPEEVTLSPLYKLGLLEERNGMIYKREAEVQKGSYDFLLFILLSYCQEQESYQIDIEDLINNEGLWGKIYNLPRKTIINILNELTLHPTCPVSFIRTNNLDMIRVQEIDPTHFLTEMMNLKG